MQSTFKNVIFIIDLLVTLGSYARISLGTRRCWSIQRQRVQKRRKSSISLLDNDMNQIFDKLGIYDLVAVLLSGVSITTFSLWVDCVFFESQLAKSLDVEETLLFWVISYFIGQVFQEIGSIVEKQIINKNDRLLVQVFADAPNISQFLTKKERDNICLAVPKELNPKSRDNVALVYNYCKYYLIRNGNTARTDKDHSTSGMSRSLSIYFFCVFLFVLCSAIAYHSVIYSENWFVYSELHSEF